MNSRSGRPDAPASRTKASNSDHSGRWLRSYSARNCAHCERSPVGRPEKTGGTSGSGSSAGLHERMRTHGRPLAASAGKATTLSSQIASGCSSSMISVSRGLT